MTETQATKQESKQEPKQEPKQIPNAQLAAFCKCQPSTIHTWKVGGIPPQAYQKVAVATGIPIRELIKSKDTIELIRKTYIELKQPFIHISGRDFWDGTRPNYPSLQEHLSSGIGRRR